MVEPVGTSPVNDPPEIEVVWVSTKSSAVSISLLPGLDGCEAVAILPSGFPVLTTTVSAFAGRVHVQRTTTILSTAIGRIMGHLKWRSVGDRCFKGPQHSVGRTCAHSK